MSTRIDFVDLDNLRSKFLKITYPDSVTEVFTWYKQNATDPIVLQLTIIYTTSSKDFIDTVTVNTPNKVA